MALLERCKGIGSILRFSALHIVIALLQFGTQRIVIHPVCIQGLRRLRQRNRKRNSAGQGNLIQIDINRC